MATGIIFDIKRYCVHDGPGLRTTVFMKGCPMRCRWCHNPESQSRLVELMHRSTPCIGCGVCAENCPNGAVHLNGKPVSLSPERCRCCGTCVRLCPTGAMELVGREYAVPELIAEILKDRVFYEESGGGVTFSGGEPQSQSAFLLEALRACREWGVHTVVDTCGYAPPEVTAAIRPYVDLFLYDVKSMNREKHLEITGVPNDLVLENLARLAAEGSDIVVVFPLIPGVNDDDNDVDELAEFMQDLGLSRISVLPYHRIGVGKLSALGRPDAQVLYDEPGERRVREVTAKLLLYGLEVKVGKR